MNKTGNWSIFWASESKRYPIKSPLT